MSSASETNGLKQDGFPLDKTFKQRHFLKEHFHYLNVTSLGIFNLYDLLDCVFKCITNPLCLSINMATSKEADGEVWCELLSSDKYRDAENYNENTSSHHFSFQVGTFSWANNAIADFKDIRDIHLNHYVFVSHCQVKTEGTT